MRNELIESLWVSHNQSKLSSYAGKWIAVLKNRVVASGETVKEVIEIYKTKKLKGKPLVTKIPRPDEDMYIL